MTVVVVAVVISTGHQVWAQPEALPTRAFTDVAAANNGFGLALLAQLSQGQDDNVFISPLSIALALDMTLNGAVGETQQAMMKALEVQNLSLADLNQASQYLREAVTNPDPVVEIAIANSVWLQTGEKLAPGFAKAAAGFYGAKASLVDFASPTSNAAIDAWVKQNTGGRIPAIAGPEPFEDTVCVLVDAVYFHGQWTTSFDQAKTTKAPFTLLDGSKKDLPMMSQTGGFEYLQRPGLQAIRLPYGTGRLAMYVILPGESIGIRDLGKALTAATWRDWTSSMASTSGTIVLPRFRVDYGVDLKPALAAMGMGAAFDPKVADFSGMFAGPQPSVCISDVLHKTLIDVNEQGTEAAAATAVVMDRGGPQPAAESFEMVVNRPFLCAIVDRDTGTILFLGSIVDPEAVPAPATAATAVPPPTGGPAAQPTGQQRRSIRRPGMPQHATPPGAQPPPKVQH